MFSLVVPEKKINIPKQETRIYHNTHPNNKQQQDPVKPDEDDDG